jgi:hypothetical protein
MIYFDGGAQSKRRPPRKENMGPYPLAKVGLLSVAISKKEDLHLR